MIQESLLETRFIKGLPKNLLSRATKRRVTVRSFPGASSSDMKHYLQPSLQLEPCEIILHAGINDLRDSSHLESSP